MPNSGKPELGWGRDREGVNRKLDICGLPPPQPSPTRGEGKRRDADRHAVGETDDVPIEQTDTAAHDGLGDGPRADKALRD